MIVSICACLQVSISSTDAALALASRQVLEKGCGLKHAPVLAGVPSLTLGFDVCVAEDFHFSSTQYTVSCWGNQCRGNQTSL